MPCYDPRTDNKWLEGENIESLFRRLNAATRAACEFGKIAMRQHTTAVSPQSLRWFERHCEEDELRKKRRKR